MTTPTSETLTVALIPLDERPVNTRYPQMLGAIGGFSVLMPPEVKRGLGRTPAELSHIETWLRDASQTAAAAIVSTDYLGYGNLINARITNDSVVDVIARLKVLEEINPTCPVHAFSLVTRVSNADDAVEEPEYWAQWGMTFYRYARLAHQRELGLETEGLEALSAQLPEDLKADWLIRRLRNHTVNLALLDLAARGRITSLLLTSDDTGAHGFPSRERDWLRGWPKLIGPALADRVMMHPGADEVGSALVAKMLNTREERTPQVWIEYAISEDAEIVAPYEDRPVRETVLGQIHACGCIAADSPETADFVLGVVTPSPRRTDYRPAFLEEDRRDRTAAYRDFIVRLEQWQNNGMPVALADVAYPNGADPLFSELMFVSETRFAWGQLSAYGAWNTAGNTLGVVVAQASCALRIGTDSDRTKAQSLFLTHRFLEDDGYQSRIRRQARDAARTRWGRQEPSPDSSEEQNRICALIEEKLRELLALYQSRGIGIGVQIKPNSVRLPWRRTFEVDFELE